jgi:hypothetical protein
VAGLTACTTLCGALVAGPASAKTAKKAAAQESVSFVMLFSFQERHVEKQRRKTKIGRDSFSLHFLPSFSRGMESEPVRAKSYSSTSRAKLKKCLLMPAAFNQCERKQKRELVLTARGGSWH